MLYTSTHTFAPSHSKALLLLFVCILFHTEIRSANLDSTTKNIDRLNNLLTKYWWDKPDSALIYLDKTIAYYENTNDKKSLAITYRKGGNFFFNNSYFEKAMSYYLKSLKLCEKINYKDGQAACLDNMGNLLNARNEIEFNSEEYNLSIKDHKEALAIRNEMGDSMQVANTLTNLGNTYMTGKDLDNANKCFTKAMSIYLKFNNPDGISLSYLNLGELNLKLGITKGNDSYFIKAKDDFNNCIKKCNMGKDSVHPYYPPSLLGLGKIYEYTGEKNLAISYFMKGVNVAEKMQRKDLLRPFYKELAAVYSSAKLYDKAFLYQSIYNNIKDSIINADNNKTISNLNIIYETERKEKEIAVQNTLIKKQQFQFIALLVITLSVIIITLLTSIILYSRYRSKQKNILNQIRINAIINTQEEERKRIAKDLHDSVGQLLFIIKMNLEKVYLENDKNLPAVLNNIKTSIKTLDAANLELRNIALQMMPRVLNELGIQGAIDDLLSNTQQTTGLKCVFEIHPIEKKIDETIQIGVFRIFQEILSNIIKYANATEINVNLYIANKQLVIMTEDDGNGFEFDIQAAKLLPQKKDKSGMGLLNMATRAEALNGTITFERSPTKGTITTIRIPIL